MTIPTGPPPLVGKTRAADMLDISRPTLDAWIERGVLRTVHRDRHVELGPALSADETYFRAERAQLVLADVLAVASAINGLPRTGNDRGALADCARQAAEQAVHDRVESLRLPDGRLPAVWRGQGTATGTFDMADCPGCHGETTIPAGLLHRAHTHGNDMGDATCDHCGERLAVLHPGVGNVARIGGN